MKSKIFTIIINLVLIGMVWPINEIRACGLWPSYTPKHYYAFRVYDDSELFNYDMFDRRKEKSEAIRNCELWQKNHFGSYPIGRYLSGGL